MSYPGETWHPSDGPNPMSTSSANKRSPQNQQRDFSSDDDEEHAPGVIEMGKEHTGRWTRAEHQAFLFALQQYGKEWKKVAAHVKTRTVVQTRTHAQKYFQKLQKGLPYTQDQTRMEAAIEAQRMLPIATQKRSSSAKKKTTARNPLLLTPAAMSSNFKQETEATQAAAHLMSQMSKSSTYGDRHQISRSIDPYANPQVSYSTPFHSGSSGRADNTSFSYATPNMKITVPSTDYALRKNMFPEPSPAACGKRKVLELETANTLIGVVSSGGASISSTSKDIFRKATPPPTYPNIGEGESAEATQLRKDFSLAKSASPGGGSLQIINPDHLPHERIKFRQGLDQEPTTPWDIEVEALTR